MASMGPSARSGHSHRWAGKYGPTGTQRPLTHRVWLRLSIASHGSEQTWPFPCICLQLWAQEICVVCTFQCPNIALPRTTLGLCTASWPAQFDHSSCGRESLLHAPKPVWWAGFSYTCHTLLLGETFLLHVPCSLLLWVMYTRRRISLSEECPLHAPC